MNELQIVLIVLAIIVVVGLYLFQQKKEAISESSNIAKSRSDADTALNELGNAHIPVSERNDENVPTAGTLSSENIKPESSSIVVPDSQLGFAFGDELEQPIPENISDKTPSNNQVNSQQNLLDGEDALEQSSENASNQSQQKEEAKKRKPKHVVIEADDLQETPGFDSSFAFEQDTQAPAFGIPTENSFDNIKSDQIENIEPQVFALIVMGSEEFIMTKLNQTLHGVGLFLSNSGIFVKKDKMGNEIIRVANLLEPGTFSQEQLEDKALTSAGVVLILELPTTVKAPAVMHDMILMARKISQRLNGRLYDMNRQLIKESDLQKMRDKAIEYETTAI